jgi:hypothetical protein
MEIYFTQTPPIDFWPGALDFSSLVTSIRDTFHSKKDVADCLVKIHILEREARIAFKSLGWEGDYRDEFYFGIPAEGTFQIGYIIKQSNNGTCFIASPIRFDFPSSDTISYNVKGLT